MKIRIDKSFEKDFRKLPATVHPEIKNIISQIRTAKNISELTNVKKMAGFSGFYRIKYKSYRVGIYLENDTLILSRVLHRKEIYRFFP